MRDFLIQHTEQPNDDEILSHVRIIATFGQSSAAIWCNHSAWPRWSILRTWSNFACHSGAGGRQHPSASLFLFTCLGALHRGRNLQNPNLHHIQQMRPVPLGCNMKEPENCCRYPNNLGAAAEADRSTSFEARTREINSRHLEQGVIEQGADRW